MRKLTALTAFTIAVLAMVAFTVKPNDPWEVPDEYVKMKNPVAADDESLEIGEELWAKHCKSCHGKSGEGDGPKADVLDTDSGDFSSDEFQSQSDGALFYKTKFGRDDMPEFQKKISYDEDIWHLVNYMRTQGS